MKLRIIETVLNETIEDVKRYYPKIPNDIFMELISLDPTFTGKDSVGKYGKWLLNLYNKGKLADNEFEEITPLLKQFTIYRNRIQNKDLNAYKSLDDLAEILAQVVDDDSMLTPNQKNKFLKKVKSGKIQLDVSDDYDVVLDTPNFIVYVPNTHEASMNLGKGTKWCTAHENPDWYNQYTENEHKLYIIKNKKTGERWQYSEDTGDFLDENDEEFDISELMYQDEKLSKFCEKFLGVDYYNFDGTWVYTGPPIPNDLAERVKDIVIPNGVRYIDDDAFVNCSSLTSIIIPNSVTIIDSNAFVYCDSLTSITIPNSVTSIGEGAFANCSKLKSITIPDSVTSMGSYAFEDCSDLTNITISNSLTSIGNYVFFECSSLTSITIPNSVTSIGDDTFANCSSLTSINIPNSVTSIGKRVFEDCTGLKSITIPNSVINIGDSAFSGCNNLTVYTDNDYVVDYCKENDVSVTHLSEKPKNESYRKPLKLKIKKF